MLPKKKKSLIGKNLSGEASFNSPSKRSYFGKRNLKDQPHHERILTEGIKKVESLQGYCSDFTSSINNWYEQFCAFQEATEDLSQCFLSVYRGTKEKMERVVTAYSKEVGSTKNRKLPKLWEKIEKFSADLAKYSNDIQVKKEWLEERNKTLCSYNHYAMKCAGLKAKQDKCKEAGKEGTLKQKQKIKRNQEKLGQAKAAFFKEHEAIIESLHNRWDSRFTFLDDFVTKVICNEQMFFESYVKSLQSTRNILEKAMKQSNNAPDHSPQQAEERQKWDLPGDGPDSENSQVENPGEENSIASSKKQKSERSRLPSEEQEFPPMQKSEGEIFPLQETPKKSKRKKTKIRTPQSAPVNAPTNPFASPPSSGYDPFVFPAGEHVHSEISSKRDVDFQFPISLKPETACGERVGSENQTSSFSNEQNPFRRGSAEKNGSPDPFESLFKKN